MVTPTVRWTRRDKVEVLKVEKVESIDMHVESMPVESAKISKIEPHKRSQHEPVQRLFDRTRTL